MPSLATAPWSLRKRHDWLSVSRFFFKPGRVSRKRGFFLSSYFHFFSVLLLQDVINNSDRQAVLRLSNLVEGMYKFKLTVADGKGLKGSDVVLLTVREGMISRWIRDIRTGQLACGLIDTTWLLHCVTCSLRVVPNFGERYERDGEILASREARSPRFAHPRAWLHPTDRKISFVY